MNIAGQQEHRRSARTRSQKDNVQLVDSSKHVPAQLIAESSPLIIRTVGMVFLD